MSDGERYLGLGGDEADPEESALAENVSHRFDRLAPTDAERTVAGRPSREAVLRWWEDRFGIPPATFDDHTCWEKGNGKLWVLAGDAKDPGDVEAVGTTFLRTRQEHWKPTTDAVQRFGHHATENVIDLTREEAERFAAGEDQEIERWDGDWGYLIAAHDLPRGEGAGAAAEAAGAASDAAGAAGERAILGVGLYVHGELRSMVPKGRRRDL
jgi:NOL1/NOP2/fmu family ribosome biogenesis protein